MSDASIGTKCGANRDLLDANRRARKKQIGDVCAGDQQHEADGAEQNEQRHARLRPTTGRPACAP